MSDTNGDEVKLLRDEFAKVYKELIRQRVILDNLKDKTNTFREVVKSLISVVEKNTEIVEDLLNNTEDASRGSWILLTEIKKQLTLLKKKLRT